MKSPSPTSIELSPDELRLMRTREQHLDKPLPRVKLFEAVRTVCGVQAQLSPAMMLALRARVEGLEVGDIEAAIADQHTLARTWLMRGTLHLVTAEDIHWLVSLLGIGFAEKDKRRRLQLGVDEKVSAAGLKAIRAIFSKDNTPLTRHELLDKLIEYGVEIEPKGQALIHLIAQAALEGVICLGPDREDGKNTYVLLDQWIEPPKAMAREKALAELVRRYLEGYAPADVKDFAAWSGLTQSEAQQGWKALEDADQLAELQVGKRQLSALAEQVKALKLSKHAEPIVRLLPAFDAYVLGYGHRDNLVRPEHRGEVYHGGQTVPVVMVNGMAEGVWRYDRQGKKLKITVRSFDAFSQQVQRLISEEADDIGRFWDAPVSLEMQK